MNRSILGYYGCVKIPDTRLDKKILLYTFYWKVSLTIEEGLELDDS